MERAYARGAKFHLPVDHVVADRFAEDAEPKTVNAIPDGFIGAGLDLRYSDADGLGLNYTAFVSRHAPDFDLPALPSEKLR